MQQLSFKEKKIFREYFTSEYGLFLDMNSQEFVDFFDQFGVEINTAKYGGMGSSDKQRFCRFLEVESRNLIKEILQEAYQYRKAFSATNQMVDLQKKSFSLSEQEVECLISQLSGAKKATEKQDKEEIITGKMDAKKSVKQMITSCAYLILRRLKKESLETKVEDVLKHDMMKEIRKILEKYSTILDFRVPGDKKNTTSGEKGNEQRLKEYINDVLNNH